MTRYRIFPSDAIPNAGQTFCSLGYPDPVYMYNNICIVENGNYTYKIEINNQVLREALLANKEETLRLLGIKVYDKNEQPEKIIEKVVEKVVTKTVKVKVTQDEASSSMIKIDEKLSKKYGLPVGKLVSKELLATVKPKEEV